MASKFVTVVRDGQLVQVQFSKPQAPRKTLHAYAERIEAALGPRSEQRYFVFRHGRKWHVCRRSSAWAQPPQSIKTFRQDQQEAAEMYLLHVCRG